MAWMQWRPYVSVAQRRANAAKKMSALRKKGKDIQPIEIEGRTIARSFWGKGWCDHLESFSDYENRLPRGRTYVRNGSVCHLEIRPGRIEAIVSGSELYNIRIDIEKLKPAVWKKVKQQCLGRIGSMLELLQGKLSDGVMAVVADRDDGLFPKPSEIKLNCSCPDWATMCKHVAAVMYGVGSRLDTRPELLFLLRDVDAQELISAELTVPTDAVLDGALDDGQLGDIFGIDLDDADTPPASARPSAKRGSRKASPKRAPVMRTVRNGRRTAAAQTAPARPARDGKNGSQPAPRDGRQHGKTVEVASWEPTGESIALVRKQLGYTAAQLARRLDVTAASVYRWEGKKGKLNLQSRPLAALMQLQQEVHQHA